MIFILATRFGPQDNQSIEFEYRFAQRQFSDQYNDTVFPDSPKLLSAIIIHPYLETFILEWDYNGADMHEIVLFHDFDDNETEVIFPQFHNNQLRPKYTLISHSQTYYFNHNIVREAFQSLCYNTSEYFKYFHQGGKERMKQKVIELTTAVDGFTDELDEYNEQLRSLFLQLFDNFDQLQQGVDDHEQAE